MSGTDDEVLIGTGKSPEGAAVSYYEVDRPATVGAKGSQGFVIEARDAKGVRITHSDSLGGLKSAGFTVDAPKTKAPAPVKAPVKAPEPVVEVKGPLAQEEHEPGY